jgi:hypothetical protein
VIVTVTLDRVYIITRRVPRPLTPVCIVFSHPDCRPNRFFVVFAYLAYARWAPFSSDGSPSWYTTVDTGQRNLSGAANLKVNMAANALFSADGGEMDRVAAIAPSHFKAPNVARLKTLYSFVSNDPVHQNPATQLRKSMDHLRSLGCEMTRTNPDLCYPGFQFDRAVWLGTDRKPTRFPPATVHQTRKVMPANVKGYVKSRRRDLL